jgi:hypothetical protein
MCNIFFFVLFFFFRFLINIFYLWHKTFRPWLDEYISVWSKLHMLLFLSCCFVLPELDDFFGVIAYYLDLKFTLNN